MSISETILIETDILLKAFATGVLLVFVYDLLRIIRRLLPHGIWWIAIEDLLFWIGSAITIFFMLYRENNGSLRGFSIGGVVLGMFFYSRILSKYVVTGSVFILEKILYVFFRPIVWMTKLLRQPLKIIRRKTRKVTRFFKKQLKKVWKTVRISLGKR